MHNCPLSAQKPAERLQLLRLYGTNMQVFGKLLNAQCADVQARKMLLCETSIRHLLLLGYQLCGIQIAVLQVLWSLIP